MKNTLILIIGSIVLFGCTQGPQGELVGVKDPLWYQENPYGMNYIDAGSFTMGPSDQDVPFAMNSRAKTVTVPAFYMDDTEITNREYRQFVEFVVDSVLVDAFVEEGLADAEEFMAEEVDIVFEELYGQYLGGEYKQLSFEERGNVTAQDLLLKQWIVPGSEKYEDAYAFIMDGGDFFLTGNETFLGKIKLNPNAFSYQWWWIDFKKAASDVGKVNIADENDLGHQVLAHEENFVVEENTPVFPDMLAFMGDYTHSNDALAAGLKDYFMHPAYGDYPVVGVTWVQARAFNAWRTRFLNDFRRTQGEVEVQQFRLPTEAEWEFAARGGRDLAPYPWGGPYMRNAQGCPLANFKPMRGDYVEDGASYTVNVRTYSPNDYGLYQMSGNVAEWTSTAYDELVYEYSHDLSPEYTYNARAGEHEVMTRKVVRGGSWKDIGYYCQTGTRSFEYRDTMKSYIGFRSVMSYMGRGKGGSPEDWN